MKRAPIHRSEAPLPCSPSARQRERFARARRELAERDGQIPLALFQDPRSGVSVGAEPNPAMMPDAPLHNTSPAAGPPGAGENARVAEVPHAACGRRAAGAPVPAVPRRPSVAEIRERPWLVFE